MLGVPVWPRNDSEHIVRNETSLQRIHKYILENPTQWHLDRENPDAIGQDSEWESWLENDVGIRCNMPQPKERKRETQPSPTDPTHSP